MNLQYNSAQLDKICEDKGISYLGLFGSYTRGEETPTSDVDLLVEYNKPIGLLGHAGTQNILADFLNKNVDLVIRKNIKPRLKPYITKGLVTLYEQR